MTDRRAFVPTWDDLETLFKVKGKANGLFAFAKPTPLHDAFVEILVRMGGDLSLRDPLPDHPASIQLEFLLRNLSAEAERTGTIERGRP